MTYFIFYNTHIFKASQAVLKCYINVGWITNLCRQASAKWILSCREYRNLSASVCDFSCPINADEDDAASLHYSCTRPTEKVHPGAHRALVHSRRHNVQFQMTRTQTACGFWLEACCVKFRYTFVKLANQPLLARYLSTLSEFDVSRDKSS